MTTDETLYRRFIDGDEDCLKELIDRYSRALIAYLIGYVRDPHDAEDLFIETFAYLVTRKPAIRENGLKAYLYKAARNYALRHVQKSRRCPCFSLEELNSEPESEELIESVVQAGERNRALWRCIKQLPPDCCEVLYLLYFEDMRYKEAAAVMKKTEKQIDKLAQLGKKSLRSLLEKEGFTDAYNG